MRNLAPELARDTALTAPTKAYLHCCTWHAYTPCILPGALFSFNLALNGLEEYEGGGTYFRRLEGSDANPNSNPYR